MTHPLQRRIERVRSRVRRLVALYGLSWVVGAGVTAAVILGLADYLLRFQDRGIRILCWLVLVGVFGWTAYRYLWLGLSTRLSEVELARRLQRRFPLLGDGLASAVEFLRQSEDDPTAGSVALRRAVVSQTTAEADGLDFRRALRPDLTWRAVVISIGICLVAVVLALLDPGGSRIAAARLVNPFGDVAWPQVHHLTLVEVVTRMAKGQTFEVAVVDQRGIKLPPDVRIHYRFDEPDGRVAEESEPMRLVDGIAAGRENDAPDPRLRNGMMVARRERVTRPFAYRVEGGDDHSMPWITVEVREPPALESLSVTLIPPDYTGWPVEQTDKHIHALVGTRAEVSARSTRPLRSAALRLDRGRQIQAQLAGQAHRDLSAQFVIDRSGAYWLELTDREGLSGGADTRWEIRAVPDTPPTVTIEQPASNLFVTPEADVPVRIAAKDNLAIRRVRLAFSRSDRPGEDESVVELHAGPDRAVAQSKGLSGGLETGESLSVDYHWRLAELGLQPGSQLAFYATATDYRPSSGKSDPRRLIIITHEELARRIADRQASILSKLAQVLQKQRQARRQVGDLEIRLGEVGQLDRLDLDRLRGAEMNQREVRRTLTSRSEGVPREILGLLADLENNRVDSPDVQRRMRALLDAIEQLDREHLPIIGRELTSAVKATQVHLQDQPPEQPPPDDVEDRESKTETRAPKEDAQTRPPAGAGRSTPPNVESSGSAPRPAPTKTIDHPSSTIDSQSDPVAARSLNAAGQHQDLVIATLEEMLGQLGRWDRYRRLGSRVGELLHDQEELAENTKKLGGRTLTKDPKDLLPQELADLKILARRQFDLVRDLEKIQQDMDQAAAQLHQSNPLAAAALFDAYDRARELATSGRMRSAGGAIQQNRMGKAIREQEQVVENLKEILDILANRREDELARLIRELLAAETALAEMAQKQEGLREQIEKSEGEPGQDERRRKLDALGREQEQLREEAERWARRLERLMAEKASQATGQAAEKMDRAAQAARQGDRPGASQHAQQAKQDLDAARRQLQQRRRQAELELAMEQIARLDRTLRAMRRQQETILGETSRLEGLTQKQGQLSRAQIDSLNGVARLQRLLETEATGLSKKLVGADVFHLVLSRAAGRMGRAAGLLERRQTGDPTQQVERDALQRLDQLLEALKPEEPEDRPDGSGSGSAGQGGAQGQPGSGLYAFAELKLLKLMQEEVNRRTRELEETLGSADTLTDEAREQYARLSEEQGRLADLLVSLIKAREEPENHPEALPGPAPHRDDDDPLRPLDEEELR